MNKWSSINSLSQSKLVQSAGIWFVIVPIIAKLVEGFDGEIPISLGERVYTLQLVLPFNWQLIFFSAFFFMIANVIYQANCREIVKRYKCFAEFKNDGNSRLQLNEQLKEIVWNNKKNCINENYKNIMDAYLKHYTNTVNLPSEQKGYLLVLDDLSKAKADDGNAFNFVYNVANKDKQKWLTVAKCMYICGFTLLGLIALMNVYYVAINALS